MKESLILQLEGQTVLCEFVKSARRKNIGLKIIDHNMVRVLVPLHCSFTRASVVVKREQNKIADLLHRRTKARIKIEGGDAVHYMKYRLEAAKLISDKLTPWSQKIGVSYNGVSVRNQATRWGSCSARGNLSFNYRILFLPEVLQDYVIVHELCHLRHHNHSANFWGMIAKFLPDSQQLRAELKKYRL